MRKAVRCRSAFTLVELLVVIGIIALLISILIPTLSRARQQAVGIKCAAQMKGVGQQILMYANNNKGWLYPWYDNGASQPDGKRGSGLAKKEERWVPLIFDDKLRDGTLNASNNYIPEAVICPADDPAILAPTNGQNPDKDPYGSYRSYAYNLSYLCGPPEKWLRYGQGIPRVTYSDAIIMVEKQQNVHDWHVELNNGGKTASLDQWYRPLYAQTVDASFDPDVNTASNPRKFKHGRYGQNFLYLDWSVRNDEPKMYDKANQFGPHDYFYEVYKDQPGHMPPWPAGWKR